MLSRTEEGQQWLRQFAPEDQAMATLLLDSLILVDQADFERGMEKALDDFARAHSGKIALYSAVERPEDRSKTFFPAAITVLNKTRMPENYAAPSDTGSEGYLWHFCRDYARKNRGQIFSHPGLEELRVNKVRWIVCLDDIIGSGNRMKEFIEWLYEDKTIRSWHSFGWLKIAVISYACSSVGGKVFENNRIVSDVISCQNLSYGRDIWSDQERHAIEQLCHKYAKRYKLGQPLGYKEAFSTILFSHGSPNTNPSILYKSWNGWESLVSRIGRPAGLLKKTAGRGETQQDRLLKILGQTRLTKPSLFQRMKPESRKLILFLSCIAMRKRNEHVVSEMMGISCDTVKELRDKCLELGWVNEKSYITQIGKNALEAARKNKCTSEYELKVKEDFYFPMHLRSPAGSPSATPSLAGGSHGC